MSFLIAREHGFEPAPGAFFGNQMAGKTVTPFAITSLQVRTLVFAWLMKLSTHPPNLLQISEVAVGPRLAVGLIVAFAIAKLLVHFVTIIVTQYGIRRDEFLYLAMGKHLRFWCMDFPPAIAILAKVRAVCLATRCLPCDLFRPSPEHVSSC
jgi:hypothetical protein